MQPFNIEKFVYLSLFCICDFKKNLLISSLTNATEMSLPLNITSLLPPLSSLSYIFLHLRVALSLILISPWEMQQLDC